MLPTDKPMSSQLLDKAGLGRGMSIFFFFFLPELHWHCLQFSVWMGFCRLRVH